MNQREGPTWSFSFAEITWIKVRDVLSVKNFPIAGITLKVKNFPIAGKPPNLVALGNRYVFSFFILRLEIGNARLFKR